MDFKMKCPHCSNEVSPRAQLCPHCGEPSPFLSKVLGIIFTPFVPIVGVVILIVLIWWIIPFIWSFILHNLKTIPLGSFGDWVVSIILLVIFFIGYFSIRRAFRFLKKK